MSVYGDRKPGFGAPETNKTQGGKSYDDGSCFRPEKGVPMSRISGKYAVGQLLALIIVAIVALPLLPLILLVIAWIRFRDRGAAAGSESEGSTVATRRAMAAAQR
jgi:hypothetical protein